MGAEGALVAALNCLIASSLWDDDDGGGKPTGESDASRDYRSPTRSRLGNLENDDGASSRSNNDATTPAELRRHKIVSACSQARHEDYLVLRALPSGVSGAMFAINDFSFILKFRFNPLGPSSKEAGEFPTHDVINILVEKDYGDDPSPDRQSRLHPFRRRVYRNRDYRTVDNYPASKARSNLWGETIPIIGGWFPWYQFAFTESNTPFIQMKLSRATIPAFDFSKPWSAFPGAEGYDFAALHFVPGTRFLMDKVAIECLLSQYDKLAGYLSVDQQTLKEFVASL